MPTVFGNAQAYISGPGASGSGNETPLQSVLMAEDIQPGSDPSYQTCKTIYLYHPLGAKMADAPVAMAQSQPRKVTVQSAPDEVTKAFQAEWDRLEIDNLIKNVAGLARVYGIASIAMGTKGKPTNLPAEMDKIWKEDIYFNVLDPLNTAGSLVLSQISTSPDFNKPVRLETNGDVFHRSRYQILMNENPVFIAYTSSGFGYVGRSVYQRALFPLKTFLRSMVADDLILTKLAVLVAKQKQPGSIADNVMKKVVAIKRAILKQAQNGNVISIDKEEDIETLDMTNVDGAGTYARTNCLKNVATSADMPAKLLENETMVEGFGEGTEDAKNIAGYIDGIRRWLHAVYAWMDNIVMYRAWNPDFYERLQEKFPEEYGGRDYFEVFSEWREQFASEWPSLLREPESEQIKVEAVKLEGLVALFQTFQPLLDPENQALAAEWLQDNVNENKRLFPHELILDFEALQAHAVEQHDRQVEAEETETEGSAADAMATKLGARQDSRRRGRLMDRFQAAVASLPAASRQRRLMAPSRARG